MKAFVLYSKQDLRPAELDPPKAGPGQVLVRVRRAGICGSDVHYFSHGRAGSFVPKRPFVLGHEFSGDVAEVGAGVDLTVGTRVAIDPSMPCGECSYCRSGRSNLCEAMRFFGSASSDPHVDGGFAEFVAVPARNCYSIPDAMSWEQAAMIEPLSVAVHAMKRAGDVAGRSVLVTGGGAIGQLVAMAARAFGARQVTLSDIVEYPRAFALSVSADAVLDPNADGTQQIALELSNGGYEVAFEAAGAASALVQALGAVRRGGTIVQVGTLPAEVTLPANSVMARELSLLGSFRFANVFPIALDLVRTGRLDVRPLVTQTFPFADMREAMARAVGKHDVIKVQVEL